MLNTRVANTALCKCHRVNGVSDFSVSCCCLVWMIPFLHLQANAVVMMLESVNEELKAEIAEKDLEISKLQSLLKEEITTVSSFKHKQKMVELYHVCIAHK